MEKTFTGIISQDGNLKLYDTAVFKAFLGTQKNKRVFVTLQTEEPTATRFTINYFIKVVCCAFVEIFKSQYGEHVNEKIASERLRSWCPVPRKPNDDLVDVEEMTQEELNYLIKHSKMIASEQFDYYIPD